ncbi:MAG: hypothetical protein M1823_006249 [Watsoniomyces obsoletus]|nr:MAG: hypothetical protein M1823_006249 [Watsoniomyces obsoletus]
MDISIQRELNDKLYEKRKVGALNLERIVREASAINDHEKIEKIIHQLCQEYAYAVHQPHARNGGLIGLAAASIALGLGVARYLQEIVPPVLACFADQDARVRYYACESMYNIAKVAKGEILIYFNEVFDALCKLAADSELSVKNGAELLDRLIKDIVSESAATYVSVLHHPEEAVDDTSHNDTDTAATADEYPTAFSLSRFIPLLTERIHVLNPFTRTFLVSWITLLDSIPDLELVYYLPAFLGGLFKFLSDPNKDVQVLTQACLERFLAEIKRIAQVKRELGNRRERSQEDNLRSSMMSSERPSSTGGSREDGEEKPADETSTTVDDASTESDWVPGQDVYVDHPKILHILVTFLDSKAATGGNDTSVSLFSHVNAHHRHSEEDIQLTALRWIDCFFEICPEDILPFVPRLLAQVLPAMSNQIGEVRQAAHRVNNSLMEYIVSLSKQRQEEEKTEVKGGKGQVAAKDDEREGATSRTAQQKNIEGGDGVGGKKKSNSSEADLPSQQQQQHQQQLSASILTNPKPELDYTAAVNALTLQFLNEHEATRIAALTWLIMLHRMAPRKAPINDETFPALLKTLSDPAEAVVTRDLQLLSQISKNSEDDYFTSFMINLLQLFCTDRRLLETRGNLIIRQLCVSLSAERIYRTLADCLEKDEDMEFASIMIQNLNNNLITAPELADLRKRLKNLETKDGQTLFVTLFRSWCHNAVATFSLCLLAQAYEQAYNLLQIFTELEMTIQMLIQIDKLVQLLESPVFTYLRLQLLEPEKHPHLYKCLYGLLMLLPQSSAFAALKNRLNSVSAIGFLHIAPRITQPQPSTSSTYDRPNRLKGSSSGRGEDKEQPGGNIKWIDLLEKFKSVQERSRRQWMRRQQMLSMQQHGLPGDGTSMGMEMGMGMGLGGRSGSLEDDWRGVWPGGGGGGDGLGNEMLVRADSGLNRQEGGITAGGGGRQQRGSTVGNNPGATMDKESAGAGVGIGREREGGGGKEGRRSSASVTGISQIPLLGQGQGQPSSTSSGHGVQGQTQGASERGSDHQKERSKTRSGMNPGGGGRIGGGGGGTVPSSTAAGVAAGTGTVARGKRDGRESGSGGGSGGGGGTSTGNTKR